MANFTSEWEWVSLNENYNTSFGGGAYNVKTPETVQRFRWSDQVYNSDIGDQASSLSGYNGAVTPETRTAPTLANVVRASSATN